MDHPNEENQAARVWAKILATATNTLFGSWMLPADSIEPGTWLVSYDVNQGYSKKFKLYCRYGDQDDRVEVSKDQLPKDMKLGYDWLGILANPVQWRNIQLRPRDRQNVRPYAIRISTWVISETSKQYIQIRVSAAQVNPQDLDPPTFTSTAYSTSSNPGGPPGQSHYSNPVDELEAARRTRRLRDETERAELAEAIPLAYAPPYGDAFPSPPGSDFQQGMQQASSQNYGRDARSSSLYPTAAQSTFAPSGYYQGHNAADSPVSPMTPSGQNWPTYASGSVSRSNTYAGTYSAPRGSYFSASPVQPSTYDPAYIPTDDPAQQVGQQPTSLSNQSSVSYNPQTERWERTDDRRQR